MSVTMGDSGAEIYCGNTFEIDWNSFSKKTLPM